MMPWFVTPALTGAVVGLAAGVLWRYRCLGQHDVSERSDPRVCVRCWRRMERR